MTTETEKSPRDIAESIAVRGLPFSAFINSVEYGNVRYWIANAVDEALRDERERCAKIADKEAQEWSLASEDYKRSDPMYTKAVSRSAMAQEIASAIRGKS